MTDDEHPQKEIQPTGARGDADDPVTKGGEPEAEAGDTGDGDGGTSDGE